MLFIFLNSRADAVGGLVRYEGDSEQVNCEKALSKPTEPSNFLPVHPLKPKITEFMFPDILHRAAFSGEGQGLVGLTQYQLYNAVRFVDLREGVDLFNKKGLFTELMKYFNYDRNYIHSFETRFGVLSPVNSQFAFSFTTNLNATIFSREDFYRNA